VKIYVAAVEGSRRSRKKERQDETLVLPPKLVGKLV
jgi:hypothetical protein